ncbi:MAG: adenylate/guanylate cyclase domain-containing protein, partial [Rubrivivax sp.]
EFASVVDAVTCAVAVQREMAEINASGQPPVELRIGINLGDIIIETQDILGDGVNVAARLEAQAAPGGLLVSDIVHGQVCGKVGITFDEAGPLQLKNIDRSVRGWRWHPGRPSQPGALAEQAAPHEVPTLAVLPFLAMSDDPEQAFFADGLVDDILTTLSRLSGLSVIARQSSFAYRGRALDIRQIASELGVRFVLEGSVRKAGPRMRVTARLVDASRGAQVWAGRFDRDVEDIFALQDEITLRLANELQIRLVEGEAERLRHSVTSNLAAWMLWIEGLQHHRGEYSATTQMKARQAWERALAIDPSSATLHALLGHLDILSIRFGWWDDRQVCGRRAMERTQRALALDPHCADAYRNLTNAGLGRGDFRATVGAARQLAALSPHSADLLASASFALQSAGHAGESLPLIARALKVCPNAPPYFHGVLGNGLRLTGRLDEAREAFAAHHARAPGFGLLDIVLVERELGRTAEARAAAAQLLEARPGFTVESWRHTQLRADTAQLERELQWLRSAGLPG